MAEILTREQLSSIVQDYISKLKSKINIEQIYLYGSYAKGNPNEWSDIDLYVISKDFPEDYLKGQNGYFLYTLLGNHDLRLEVIGIHPKQLENPIEKSFFEEVESTGQTIYENKC